MNRLAGGAAFALLIGVACTAKEIRFRAGDQATRNCVRVTSDGEEQAPDASTTVAALSVCIEGLRGHSRTARVTLELNDSARCVQVRQRGGQQLAYDDASDVPNRSELQLEPPGSTTSFVIGVDPGESAPGREALRKVISGLDGSLEIQVFDVSCVALCRRNVADLNLQLAHDRDDIYVKRRSSSLAECRFFGMRAGEWERPDAGAARATTNTHADAGAAEASADPVEAGEATADSGTHSESSL